MSKRKQHHGTANDIEHAFYDALARADLDALMALWADEEDIICVHPGAPRLVGHAAIRASWEAIFERGSVHIHTVQLVAMHNMLTVIHNLVEEIKRSRDDQQDLHILATNVYVKTPHGWRIAIHHASVAPGTAPADPLFGAVLH